VSQHALPAGDRRFETVRAAGGVTEYRHTGNGLTVLLLPEASASVVAFQVTYRVGSRNEGTGLTGATHLLEHLMFKGSERFNRDLGTSVFQTLQAVGGQINATTWYDRTNYYAMLPADHLALAVEIEADRMRGARVRDEDLAGERTVVLNELDRGENQPLRRLLHAVHATAFHAHPYRHPVIGWRGDVEAVSAAGLRSFYDTYYWPRHATAAVVGAFDPEATLALLDAHFGGIEAGPEPPATTVTPEPPQRGERRVTVKQAGELGAVLLAWKAPHGLDADADALDVLVQILAAGKSARLYRRLVDTGRATSTWAYFPRLRDPGLFFVYAALAPLTLHADIETELKAALAEIAADGVTDAELERARRQVVADEAFGRDGPMAAVSQLNEAVALGDWTLFAERRDRLAAVTGEAVQATAARLADDDRLTVGWYVPE